MYIAIVEFKDFEECGIYSTGGNYRQAAKAHIIALASKKGTIKSIRVQKIVCKGTREVWGNL